MKRCDWAVSEISTLYHDQEWGVPVFNDQKLFEFLVLEGAQAGLSWETILNKRMRYREVFDYFDPRLVTAYDAMKIEQLMGDAGIIRNRLKINSAIQNARAFLRIQDEFGSFHHFIWGFVGGKPIQNSFNHLFEIPAATEISRQISKELKKRGMSFIGPTIIYAFMQAVGMVNDHQVSCFRYAQLSGVSAGED